MEEIFKLGDIRCPSGNLVVVDGGHLGVWSGERSPAEIDPEVLGIDDPSLTTDVANAVDFTVLGLDAEEAARSFDRQPGVMIYDIPASGAEEMRAAFEEHCRTAKLNAWLEALPEREAHAQRVRRAAAAGGGGFFMFGIPVIALGGIPSDRDLPVFASRADFGPEIGEGWSRISILISDAPAETSRSLGEIRVDWARVLFGDTDALNAWQHDEPVDGLADVAFWGADVHEAAARFDAPELGEPGEDGTRGWCGLALPEAVEKARALLRWKEETGRRMAVDFRPHSHHWQIMRQVRASELEYGVVDLADARVLCAMTGWGDGSFPVTADFDSSGEVVSVHLELAPTD
ncbi:hypothetical protein [Embleya sp. NPDC059237]|uniref:hypothetical protein n=1 Tax=Embleya sp. NPDC059237 TaxID=3346784 RepID=UPI0036737F23